jgi:hypothetical protein
MRALIRGISLATALSALALTGCQRQGAEGDSAAGGPSNAAREAAVAAEQLEALGRPANAQQRALFEGDFQASGDVGAGEGAWELFLLSDYAQFSRPGLGEDGGVAGERDYRERGVRVVAGPLTVTLSNETCQASSGELPYTAHVLFEGVAYTGCARRGLTEGERPTWASVLPDLIPAIDACLARATGRSTRVTFGAAIDEGAISVRLRGADGARHECVVDAAGAVTVFESLSDLDRRNGEGDPEFLRGGAEPRAANCRVVEPALGATGEELGWLIRRTC